jgi:hypothetical protein
MSSDDELHDGDDLGYGPDDKNKKRRIQRACDTCRRKKSMSPPHSIDLDNRLTSNSSMYVSCRSPHLHRSPPRAGDGAQMVDNRCTNCITWNLECTYVEAAKVRRSPPPMSLRSSHLTSACRNAALPKGLLLTARLGA